MNGRVNIGIVGVGRMGRVHARNLATQIPKARVVALCDIQSDVAEACAKELGIPRAFADSKRIFEDDRIQAVLICSSTETHAQLVMDAASAGKYIFCEKPISPDLMETRRALSVVERTGAKIQVGFNRRFDPTFKRMRELVVSGKLGTVHTSRITSRDPQPPSLTYLKTSGGLFMDMTVHDFDMARFLVNSNVSEIYAVGSVLIDPEIGVAGDIDTAVVTLRYENGALGIIENSRRAIYGYDNRAEVFGSGGVVVSDHSLTTTLGGGGCATDSGGPFFLRRYAEAYVEELREFVASVDQGTQPSPNGFDGYIAALMGMSACQSLRESRPVRLKDVEEAASRASQQKNATSAGCPPREPDRRCWQR